MKAKKSHIKPKPAKFAYHRFCNMSQVDAYLAAGYKDNPETNHKRASRLEQDPRVKEERRRLDRQAAKKAGLIPGEARARRIAGIRVTLAHVLETSDDGKPRLKPFHKIHPYYLAMIKSYRPTRHGDIVEFYDKPGLIRDEIELVEGKLGSAENPLNIITRTPDPLALPQLEPTPDGYDWKTKGIP